MSAFRRSAAFQALLLGVFATVAAAILAAVDLGTAGAIAERRAEDLRASLAQVVPAELYDNNLLADPIEIATGDGGTVTVYRGRKDGMVTAVAFETRAAGYAGDIVLLMGVDRAGAVQGVRVLAHVETPGLGDKIEAAKSDWILGFEGRSLGGAERWAVRKDGGDFDQFSGATITPRAVVHAVKEGLEFFAARRGELLRTVTADAEEGAADD